jgi:gp178|nr:MAG TPA: Protein of unknown function (DUF1642) [Caudoviricetes sp.]
MNKKELIKKYKELENGTFDIGALVVCQSILKDLEQLDEPQKVTIPQFVANYIEYTKKEDYHLLGAMCEVRKHENKEIDHWLYTDDNIETFALSWMFGYTIKKEPRYFVEIKATKHRFARDGKGKIFFSLAYKSPFTKKELEEKGFGWVFNCTGIELLEVEE